MSATLKTVPIIDIIIGERYRKDLGDLNALAASIRDSPAGMLQPIILGSNTKDGLKLIAGQRRLESAKLLGWLEVPAIVVDSFDDALAREGNAIRFYRQTGEVLRRDDLFAFTREDLTACLSLMKRRPGLTFSQACELLEK